MDMHNIQPPVTMGTYSVLSLAQDLVSLGARPVARCQAIWTDRLGDDDRIDVQAHIYVLIMNDDQ